MHKTVLKKLNHQIQLEHESAYAYLIMSGFFEDQGFRGFAKWARKQSEEEVSHMMKIYHYVFERQATIQFTDIKATKASWLSVQDAFKSSLRQEKKVTKSIYDILESSIQHKDYPTQEFLQWFVKEQVEEEATIADILHKFSLIGDNKAALIMMDKELGEREHHDHD